MTNRNNQPNRTRIGSTQARNVRRMVRLFGEKDTAAILKTDIRQVRNWAKGTGFINRQDAFRIGTTRNANTLNNIKRGLWKRWWDAERLGEKGLPHRPIPGQETNAKAIDAYMNLLRHYHGNIPPSKQEYVNELFQIMGFDGWFPETYVRAG